MPIPTGVERTFGDDEIIVSKTDRTGRIIYANDVFLRVAGYRESEVLQQPHSILRHPAMPRCVFALLWDTIQSGKEIFAYVVNITKNGDHYWVFAHVTPTFGRGGSEIIGYHSSRRSPTRASLAQIQPIYEQLLAEERKHAAKADQVAAGTAFLTALLASKKVEYDEFVFSLGEP